MIASSKLGREGPEALAGLLAARALASCHPSPAIPSAITPDLAEAARHLGLLIAHVARLDAGSDASAQQEAMLALVGLKRALKRLALDRGLD